MPSSPSQTVSAPVPFHTAQGKFLREICIESVNRCGMRNLSNHVRHHNFRNLYVSEPLLDGHFPHSPFRRQYWVRWGCDLIETSKRFFLSPCALENVSTCFTGRDLISIVPESHSKFVRHVRKHKVWPNQTYWAPRVSDHAQKSCRPERIQL